MISFGIHIGSSSMCIAAQKDERIDVIANDAGDRVTPAIYGLQDNESLVGLSAKQLSSRKPASVALNTKSRINDSNYEDYLLEDNGNQVKVSTEKIHTKFYKYMQDIAASYASDEVKSYNSVITVPLEFTKKQRELVKKCAISAGFHVSQVISEPSAAILAYDLLQHDVVQAEHCLIFRCGGTSLTCSIVLITPGGMMSVLKSINKDIGGDLVTDVLIEMLAQEFIRKYKMDPRESKRGKMKLKINADNVKHVLSTLDNANCYIESLHEGIDFNANISRSRFNSEFGKLLQRFLDPIEEVLEASSLKAADISKVIICGGTSKIPKLQTSIKGLFDSHVELLSSINPDEVIASGAAAQAAFLPSLDDDNEQQTQLNNGIDLQCLNQDIVFSLNDDQTEQVLIAKYCPIPVRKSHHLATKPGNNRIAANVYLRFINQEKKEIAKLCLSDVNEDSKCSLSAHVHRDGGLHIALTDKTTNKCDQVTLPSSTKT